MRGVRRPWNSPLLIGSLALWGVLVPCTAVPASPSSSTEQQALIEQLKELSEEIKGLRQEIRQLRGAVKEMSRPAAAPPRATPPPAAVDVALGDGPMLGDAEATVGIVEFTDFQCPFCKRFHDQTFGQLKTTYIDTGKIQYLLRDFPLGFHRQAKGASIAAHCAGKQGAYWSMHHELFTNQRRLGPKLYEELARKLELNGEQFATCLEEPAQAKAVETDFAYGQSVGVRGTPNFFVGRIEDGKLVGARRISGAQPLAAFQRVLDPLLK